MATTIAISNQKGGVGKTTTAIHLAAALTLADQKVLLIDLDSQANATTGLGVAEARGDEPGAYLALAGDMPAEVDWTKASVMRGLSVLPASLDLAGIDLELGDMQDGTGRLKRALEPLQAHFDWIIMDCPPSLGMLSVNALIAADHVVTPLPPERFAIDGLERLQVTMQRLREAGRVTAPDPMILLTRTQAWSDSHRKRMIALRNDHGERVLVAEVPLAPGLEEAADQRRPVFMDMSHSTGGDSYLNAAAEILLTCRQTKIDTAAVLELVSTMKAELERRRPTEAPAGETTSAVIPPAGSWLSRGLIALRYGRHRRLIMLGGVSMVIIAAYTIGMVAT